MFLAFALALVGDVAANAPAAEPEKKVCKSAEAETGSMMLKKVCRTKSEWAAIAKSNKANAERYKRDRPQSSGNMGSMSGGQMGY